MVFAENVAMHSAIAEGTIVQKIKIKAETTASVITTALLIARTRTTQIDSQISHFKLTATNTTTIPRKTSGGPHQKASP